MSSASKSRSEMLDPWSWMSAISKEVLNVFLYGTDRLLFIVGLIIIIRHFELLLNLRCLPHQLIFPTIRIASEELLIELLLINIIWSMGIPFWDFLRLPFLNEVRICAISQWTFWSFEWVIGHAILLANLWEQDPSLFLSSLFGHWKSSVFQKSKTAVSVVGSSTGSALLCSWYSLLL